MTVDRELCVLAHVLLSLNLQERVRSLRTQKDSGELFEGERLRALGTETRIETARSSSFDVEGDVSKETSEGWKMNSGCGFPWKTRRRPLRNSAASGPKGVGRHMCLVLV